ncbi:MAG: CoB--CoM heterodisulfide reductase iron-sulfur subunit B family protein, partial [bacterium]
MAEETSKIALFTGCSLEGTSIAYITSMESVFNRLGLLLGELKDWNCCGATSAHSLDNEFHLMLNLRNLYLAQEQDYAGILAPCAACYHRLASANSELHGNQDILDELNKKSGLNYKADLKIWNILEFLHNTEKKELIKSLVTAPLSGLKAACYYGCLNTRLPRIKPFDNIEYPKTMDKIIQALGAETVEWAYKTECCGASLFITNESVCKKLVAKILRDAAARHADCIVVACPM